MPDSDPNSSDIKVSLVESSEVSRNHTDFGNELGDDGPTSVKYSTVTANTNIPN